MNTKGLTELAAFLDRIPATRVMATSDEAAEEAAELRELMRDLDGDDADEQVDDETEGLWWIKIELDIADHFAWHVVQELGFVLNYLSLEERLPTVFMPTSSPPYLNGGPDACLGWVIESTLPDIDPRGILAVLEERLPTPVSKRKKWTACESAPCSVRGRWPWRKR